eukprot:scaffold5092_cov61-Cylindrotheca_fusiformis.AAC.6
MSNENENENDNDDNNRGVVDYEHLQKLGLSVESFAQSGGKEMILHHFDEILQDLTTTDTTSNISKATKVAMADMFSNWHHLSNEETKALLYNDDEKVDALFHVIQSLIPTNKDVEIASSLINGGMSTTLMMNKKYGTAAMIGRVIDTLRIVIGLELKASKPLESDGPAQFRASCVCGLLGCFPCNNTEKMEELPDDTVDVLASFLLLDDDNDAPTGVQQAAHSTLSMLTLHNSHLFPGHLEKIFQSIHNHPTSCSLLGQVISKKMIELDEQGLFMDHLDYFLEVGLQTTYSIFQQIATHDAQMLIPVLDRIVNIAKSSSSSLYASSAMMWLKEIALATTTTTTNDDKNDENDNDDDNDTIITLELVQDLYESAFQGGNNGIECTYAMLVGAACKKNKTLADDGIRLLIQMLKDPRLSKSSSNTTTSSVILHEIDNLKNQSSGPKFFRESLNIMETILQYQSYHSTLVQQLQDWVAGRSLEQLSERMERLEHKLDYVVEILLQQQEQEPKKKVPFSNTQQEGEAQSKNIVSTTDILLVLVLILLALHLLSSLHYY